MQSYQSMTYAEHLQRNSSEYIYSIQNLATNFSNNIVMVGLRTIGDVITAVAIFTMLAWTNITALLLLVTLLGLMIFGYDQLFYHKMYENVKKINKALVLMTQGISEGVNGFKEIRILGKNDFFYKKVQVNALDYSKHNLSFQVISIIPRYILEFLLIAFVVLLVMGAILLQHEFTSLISLLGVFGMAAMRLMPIANGFSNSISQLRFGRDTVSRLYSDLSGVKVLTKDKVHLEKAGARKFDTLELDGVGFRYSQGSRMVLNNISLKISSGESIGLIGPSGSGKTTLIDVLLGLHNFTDGKIKYNGKDFNKTLDEWRSQVAYLPQNLFIIDDTLKSNVALGVNKGDIDNELLYVALKQARLLDFVEGQPNGINTMLGEGGIRLSGGQRQRVALARAFYHRRNILVMDESTSALDQNVEDEIVNEIKMLKGKKTMIIIAHRLSTLKYCDRIYKIENGSLTLEKNNGSKYYD